MLGPTMSDGKGYRDHVQWINLQTGKEFSRLLYPNPVCFLSTVGSGGGGGVSMTNSTHPPTSSSMDSEPPLQQSSAENSVNKNVMILSWLTPTNNQGRFMFSIHKTRYSALLLAPSIDPASETSSCGANGSSIDITSHTHMPLTEFPKRKYPRTVSVDNSNYQTGTEFVLSVPVKGMEQLVMDVGSISGRYGSKFSSSECRSLKINDQRHMENFDDPKVKLSSRQRKKIKKRHLSLHGVPGLIPVPLGHSFPSTQSIVSSSSLFAIQGTVAHLKCRTYAVIGTPHESEPMDKTKLKSTFDSNQKTCNVQGLNKDEAESDNEENNDAIPAIIDHDHLLILAEVVDAYVHPLYWDRHKLLFRPCLKNGRRIASHAISTTSASVAVPNLENDAGSEIKKEEDLPPYLTFFGSQTLGYVTTGA